MGELLAGDDGRLLIPYEGPRHILEKSVPFDRPRCVEPLLYLACKELSEDITALGRHLVNLMCVLCVCVCKC